MKPYYETKLGKMYHGDALQVLKSLPDELVHCCVTSPPYWGLRDYGLPPIIWDGDSECQHVWGDMTTPARKKTTPSDTVHKEGFKDAFRNSERYVDHIADETQESGQFCQICGAWRGCLGLEPTPELFIKHIVEIFREVRRVLRKDGTLWLNMGDSYWGGKGKSGQAWATNNQDRNTIQGSQHQITGLGETRPSDGNHPIYKPKDLCGIPWRLALALQADGWWLRSDIIWHKPNPMPESVTDRPTKAHEYVFLLTKSAKYFYDAEAIREPDNPDGRKQTIRKQTNRYDGNLLNPFQDMEHERWSGSRNKRTVWTIPTKPFPEAHFATFPPALIEPCILAGTSEKGCCAECGAPWERVVEPTKEYAKLLGRDLLKKNEHPKSDILSKGWSQEKSFPRVTSEYKTTGAPAQR